MRTLQLSAPPGTAERARLSPTVAASPPYCDTLLILDAYSLMKELSVSQLETL